LKTLSYNPLKLLVYCKSLCKNQSPKELETVTRTVVSRAYYSAFLHSREYLRERRVYLVGGSRDHIDVENYLKRIDRVLGSMLRTLRQNRQAADYNLRNPARIRNENRTICFDKNSQQDALDIAEYITHSLPRR
jgi:hypothetical protein